MLILGVQMSELPHFSGSHESIRHIFRKEIHWFGICKLFLGKCFLLDSLMNPDTCPHQIIVKIFHTTGSLPNKAHWPVL